MTKAELIRRVAERTGTTLKLARQLVNATFDEIASALEDGEEITIPAKKVVKFRTSKALQDKLTRYFRVIFSLYFPQNAPSAPNFE